MIIGLGRIEEEKGERYASYIVELGRDSFKRQRGRQ